MMMDTQGVLSRSMLSLFLIILAKTELSLVLCHFSQQGKSQPITGLFLWLGTR